MKLKYDLDWVFNINGKERIFSKLLFVLGSMLVLLLIRNLTLSSPIMGGDEYAFYATAREFGNLSLLYVQDPRMQQANTPIFAAIGNTLFSFTGIPDKAMSGINAIIFLMSVILMIFSLFKLSGQTIPLSAVIIFLIFPFSAFSAYFMPETLYLFVFWLLILVLIFLLPNKPELGAIVGGIIIGILLLIKPHAISAFIALILTIIALGFAPGKIRITMKKVCIMIMLLIGMTYFSEVLLNALFTQNFQWNPIMLVGGSYKSILNKGLTSVSWLSHPEILLSNAAAHLAILIALVGIPLIIIFQWISSIWSKNASIRDDEVVQIRQRYILIIFTLMATLIFIAMVVNFAGQEYSSPLRLHGRYYSFIFPLYFIIYYMFNNINNETKYNSTITRIGAIIGLMGIISLIYIKNKFLLYPWDYPEIYSLSSGLFPVIFVLGIMTYGIVAWRMKPFTRMYPIFVIVLFLLSNVQVVMWQYEQANNVSPVVNDAKALRVLIPVEERTQGVIIGEDRWGKMAYFLFGYSSNAAVRVKASGSKITSKDIPPGAKWVILLDKYDVELPVEGVLSTKNTWYGQLSRGQPAIHENVHIWNGRSIQYNFSTGKDTYILDQFNVPEELGTWSASDGARLLLPIYLFGKVEIEIAGWTMPENIGQQLYIEIGSETIPIKFNDKPSFQHVTANISRPVREIVFRGVKPYRKNAWEAPRGFALQSIRINKHL